MTDSIFPFEVVYAGCYQLSCEGSLVEDVVRCLVHGCCAFWRVGEVVNGWAVGVEGIEFLFLQCFTLVVVLGFILVNLHAGGNRGLFEFAGSQSCAGWDDGGLVGRLGTIFVWGEVVILFTLVNADLELAFVEESCGAVLFVDEELDEFFGVVVGVHFSWKACSFSVWGEVLH